MKNVADTSDPRKPPWKAGKQSASKRKPSARGRGRPPKSERPIGPEALQIIADGWSRCASIMTIADRLGVDEKTVRHHLQHTIKPMLRERLADGVEKQLHALELLQRIAWERFEASQGPVTRIVLKQALMEGGLAPETYERIRTKIKGHGEVQWLHVIHAAIEMTCKLRGHFENATHSAALSQEDYRVAGKSPSEVNRAMVQRLNDRIKEMEQYEAAWADNQ